jgi:hypothetical protein
VLNQLLWNVCLIVLRWVLGVSKEMVTAAIIAVDHARDLKHDDGTPYTGDEKKDYVIDQLINKFDTTALGDTTKSTLSSLTSIIWSYLQTKLMK